MKTDIQILPCMPMNLWWTLFSSHYDSSKATQ